MSAVTRQPRPDPRADAHATRVHPIGRGIVVAALFGLAASASCAVLGSGAPPRISTVVLARSVTDMEHFETTTTFAPSDRVIHAVVTIMDPAQDGTLSVKWYWTMAGTFQLLYEEQHRTLIGAMMKFDITVTVDQDWPATTYRLDVSLDTGDTRSVEFEVR